MTTIVKRKNPCAKCGSLYNYKCRSCVGCSKNKSHIQYSNRLTLMGKKRNKTRKLAKQAGKNTYKSNCNRCSSNKKYVSSAGCIKCHKDNAKKAYTKKRCSEERKQRFEFRYQITFNSLMGFDGTDAEWYEAAIKSPNFERSIVESIRKTGRNDKKRQRNYYKFIEGTKKGEKILERLDALENNPIYIAYLHFLSQYERSPKNAKCIFNLLEAEFNMHNIVRKRHSHHPSYPKKYFLFNPKKVPEGDNFKFFIELQILRTKLNKCD